MGCHGFQYYIILIIDISNILIIAEHNTNHLMSNVNPTYVLRYTEYITSDIHPYNSESLTMNIRLYKQHTYIIYNSGYILKLRCLKPKLICKVNGAQFDYYCPTSTICFYAGSFLNVIQRI